MVGKQIIQNVQNIQLCLPLVLVLVKDWSDDSPQPTSLSRATEVVRDQVLHIFQNCHTQGRSWSLESMLEDHF